MFLTLLLIQLLLCNTSWSKEDDTLPLEKRMTNQWPKIESHPNQWPKIESQPNQWPKIESDQNQWPKIESHPNQWPKIESQPNQWPKIESDQTQWPKIESDQTQWPKIESHPNQWPKIESQPNQWPKIESHPNQWPKIESHPNQWPKIESQPNQWPKIESDQNQWPKIESHPNQCPKIESQPNQWPKIESHPNQWPKIESHPNQWPKIDSKTPQTTYYRDLIPSWAVIGDPRLKLPEESIRKLLVIFRDTEPAIFSEFAYGELCEGQTLPSPPPQQAWVVGRVKDLVQDHPNLRNETDNFMNHFQYFYSHLALDEDDNVVNKENAIKYGMSLIFRFLLEFYMIYRKALEINVHSILRPKRLIAIDDHGVSYDKALEIMRGKKYETPLQIAAPVRRAADIFKSIIDESVKIVQSKCSIMSQGWECAALYVAGLASQASNCSNIWYHAFVHLTVLGSKYSFDEGFATKLADIEMFQDLIRFDHIFDVLIQKIAGYREVVRVGLREEGSILDTIADLQDKGLLNCVNVENIDNIKYTSI